MRRRTILETGYRLDRFCRHFGDRPLNQLNRKAIESWLGDLEHLAPSTRRLNLSTVGTFCRWLVAQGEIRRDPTAGLRIPKPRSVPRALRHDQIVALYAVLPDDRALVIVTLMLYLGLRCCEVGALKMEDIDFAAGTVMVVGKGGHQRILPIPDDAKEVLHRYTMREHISWGPVIRSMNEPWKGLTSGAISRLAVKWMAEAGIKNHRFDGVAAHALRHTAASDTLEHCGDLEAVREMLGHVSLTTTQVYLRRAGIDRLRVAMEGRSYAS